MTGTFRSLIKKYFPTELLVQLEVVANDKQISNNQKTDEIVYLLNKYDVPFSPLGNGTNRYGILIDGYAVKIALDRAGQIDNMREFKYAKRFGTDVVRVYECTPGVGTVAVFEYITIFSLSDMEKHQDEMREILGRITENFLVGDMGVSVINYINWGTRLDGTIAILDFAYIYSLSYKGFLCSCEDEGVLQYDHDFNFLICPFCRKKYSFADIRKRITREDEINEIGDIRNDGYVLTEQVQTLEINLDESEHLRPKKKKKKEKSERVKDDKVPALTKEMQEEQLNLLNSITSGGNNHGKKGQGAQGEDRQHGKKHRGPA